VIRKNREYGLIGILSLSIIYIVSACQYKPSGVRPFDYPPAKWVSESGDFWFAYTGTEEKENSSGWPIMDGGYMIEGKSYKCKVEFAHYYEVFFYGEDEEEIFMGTCVFGAEKLKVRVLKGKYKGDKKITFIRYPLETESEEKDTEIR